MLVCIVLLAIHSVAASHRYYYFIVRPPLRQYLLDGEFFVGAALAGTLTKVALRYIGLVADPKKQNVRYTVVV